MYKSGMYKRLLSALLSFVLLTCMTVGAYDMVPAAADTGSLSAVDSGTCGDNLTWTFADGVLTISGSGRLERIECDCADEVVSVVIEEGITTICEDAFFDFYYIEEVTVPASVTTIEQGMFKGIDFSSVFSLKTISVKSGNPYYYSLDGVLFDKNDVLVAYPAGKTASSYTVPAGTTAIAAEAFSSTSYLTDVTLPDSVTSIGDEAFYCSGITSIDFGNGVEEIGKWAFYISDLEELVLPDSLTRLGDWAFDWCYGLTGEVVLGSNVASIGYAPFCGCSGITSISVSSDNSCFQSIDGVLFSSDGTVLVQYPAGKAGAAYTIPEGVTEINGDAFENCTNLTSVSLPDSLEVIGFMAFYGCEIGESLVLPAYVAKIDGCAFSGSSVTSLYFKGNMPEVQDFLGGFLDEGTIYYPEGDTTWALDAPVNNWGRTARTCIGEYLNYETWDTPVVLNRKIANCTITLSQDSYTYNGYERKPSVTVTNGDYTLICGTDYTLSYADNKDAGTATVLVEGIGNYKGSAEKTFTISKANQSVTATLSVSSLAVGSTTVITAKGQGSLTYSSSNTSVATVSSAGVVTAKSAGTAVITVTAAGTDNYNSASKTLTVTVTSALTNPISLQSLSYSFGNSYKSFGYDTNYRIPLSRYQMFFSSQRAQELYDTRGYWHGSCYGMATTSCMFNINGNDLTVTDFHAGAAGVGDLTVSDKNSAMNLTVLQLIEAMFVTQYAGTVQSIYTELKAETKSENLSGLSSLTALVKKVDSGGLPLVLAIMERNSGGGHAIVGYALETVNSTTEYLHVYDNNYPNEDRYIRLTKNSAGAYTSWYYTSKYNSDTYNMTYIPYATYEAVWEGRTGNTVSTQSMLTVSADSFSISDLQGNVLAAMENGEFTSTDSDIYEMSLVDATESDNGHLIYLPTGTYQIVDTSGSTDEIEIGMVDVDQSISITTQADVVTIQVDDSQATGLVRIDGESGELYKVTFSSDMDYAEDAAEVSYSGRCEDETITVGSSYGETVTDNYENSGLYINDTAVNAEKNDVVDLSYYKIALSETAYTYDGEAAKPEVSITQGGSENALVEGTDYVVVYADNTQPGEATATIYGINDYTGSVSATFTIRAAYYYGDVDMDGAVEAADALAILSHCVNLAALEEGMAQRLADGDRDGEITAADALYTLQVVVALREAELLQS